MVLLALATPLLLSSVAYAVGLEAVFERPESRLESFCHVEVVSGLALQTSLRQLFTPRPLCYDLHFGCRWTIGCCLVVPRCSVAASYRSPVTTFPVIPQASGAVQVSHHNDSRRDCSSREGSLSFSSSGGGEYALRANGGGCHSPPAAPTTSTEKRWRDSTCVVYFLPAAEPRPSLSSSLQFSSWSIWAYDGWSQRAAGFSPGCGGLSVMRSDAGPSSFQWRLGAIIVHVAL